MELRLPTLKTDIKLLSWKSVLVIGFTYLIALIATLTVSGSLFLLSGSIDGSTNGEILMRNICLTLSYSVFFASMVGLFIKLVADSVSAAYFLKKVTDTMFEPKKDAQKPDGVRLISEKKATSLGQIDYTNEFE